MTTKAGITDGTIIRTWHEDFITETCVSCGQPWAMTSTFRGQRVDDGRGFYCPAGHVQYYTRKRTRQQELARQLERAERRADQEETRRVATQDQLDAERKSKAAVKGHLTRVRRRIAAGVCPCCTRSFVDVRRHMAAKHPGYLDDLTARAGVDAS